MQVLIGRVGLYHRFGYQALPLGGADYTNAGSRTVGGTQVSARLAGPTDLAAITALPPDTGLSVIRDERHLTFELAGRSADSLFVRTLHVLEHPGGAVVGWFTTLRTNPAVIAGIAWRDVSGSEVVAAVTAAVPDVSWWLGRGHPLESHLRRTTRADRLYVRPVDVPRILNARTGDCRPQVPIRVHTGEDVWELGPEAGWAAVVHDHSTADAADVHLAPSALARLLLGTHTVAEIADADPEVEFRHEDAEPRLDALFPRLSHHLWLLG